MRCCAERNEGGSARVAAADASPATTGGNCIVYLIDPGTKHPFGSEQTAVAGTAEADHGEVLPWGDRSHLSQGRHWQRANARYRRFKSAERNIRARAGAAIRVEPALVQVHAVKSA